MLPERSGAPSPSRGALVKRARDEYEAETGRRPLAAASAGPYGAYLADGSEYSGHYDLSRRELADFHRERALILADEAPDLLAFETVPSLAEAEAIADAVSALPAGSAWLSFSCRDGETTCAGDRAEDCAAFLAGIPQIAAIGANCTAPAHIAALIGRFRAAGKPVIVYPNSGETWNKETGAWEGAPSDFGALAPAIRERPGTKRPARGKARRRTSGRSLRSGTGQARASSAGAAAHRRRPSAPSCGQGKQ